MSWVVDGHDVAVRGQTRTDVLVLLAEATGSAVSVDTILERLWKERPQSGANAVQRHISGLRSELAALGVESPHEVVQRHGAGYRLGPLVRTDLDDLGPGGAPIGHESRWWREPLLGSSWDIHRPLHARLSGLAAAHARALVEASPVDLRAIADHVGPLLRHTPAREELIDLCIDKAGSINGATAAHTFTQLATASLRADDDPQLHRRVAQLRVESSAALVSGFSADAVELVERYLGLWQQGRSREALDLLDATSGMVGEDLERRLYRWLVWMPEDPWVNHGFSILTRSSISPPRGDERMVCSVDARCLMQMTDGAQIAEREVAAARSRNAHELVRALRVRYMVGLSQPHDAAQDAVVEELASIGSSRDAAVEAARFRFVSALRCGSFDQCEMLLKDLEAAVVEWWPGSGDDFAAMARASLGRAGHAPIQARFDTGSSGHVRYLADAFVVSMADTCQALLDPQRAASVQDTALYSTVGFSSVACGTALRLVRDLYRGEPVEDLAHALALRLPVTTREMQFLILPVALTLVAERFKNREIAAAVTETLEPWAGQTLGLWPIDFVIGPCDHWLDRLASV